MDVEGPNSGCLYLNMNISAQVFSILENRTEAIGQGDSERCRMNSNIFSYSYFIRLSGHTHNSGM